MGRFVDGQDRRQSWLLPDSLDDSVTVDNPVRVIEVFIDELDPGALGFTRFEPAATGRPAYDPATLLKLYLSCRRAAGASTSVQRAVVPAARLITSWRRTACPAHGCHP